MLKTIITIIVFLINSLLVNAQEMKKEFINQTLGYSNVVSIEKGGITRLYVASQVGSGKSMEEQLHNAYKALCVQLETTNANFSDVVEITIFIVDYSEIMLSLFKKVRLELFSDQVMPAITIVGVSALAMDSVKVEMKAIAVIQSN